VECFMISCESCEGNWTVASSLSLYEQQARESHPCPKCGAYTLRCTSAKQQEILAIPVWRFMAIAS